MEEMQAEFHLHPVLNPKRSKEAGRPIHEDKLYIKIFVPDADGQLTGNSVRARPSRPDDKVNFPTAWARWQLEQAQATEGTPIDYLPGITPGLKKDLNAIDIFTLEQLLSSEIQLEPWVKQRARAYLSACEVPIDDKLIIPEKKTRGRPKGSKNKAQA